MLHSSPASEKNKNYEQKIPKNVLAFWDGSRDRCVKIRGIMKEEKHVKTTVLRRNSSGKETQEDYYTSVDIIILSCNRC